MGFSIIEKRKKQKQKYIPFLLWSTSTTSALGAEEHTETCKLIES